MKDDIIDRLFALSRNEHGDPIDDAISEIQRLRNELAASQAHEAQLREATMNPVIDQALKDVAEYGCCDISALMDEIERLQSELAIAMSDVAGMRERLKAERERCAVEAADYETGEYAAEAIRKLGDT